MVGGEQHWNLARLNPDGSVDTAFAPQITVGYSGLCIGGVAGRWRDPGGG
ncbi:MAG: delta-60 repeat domain-containing protein [Verrucomicrobiales bacterium]|nr:delta-60 repeat domain-containing protein [Verrucomicrobiales bacterium]